MVLVERVDGSGFSIFFHSAHARTKPFSQPDHPEANTIDVVLPSQMTA